MGADATALSVWLEQAGPIPLDVSFSCGSGELLALVGPSGSGKTTVLRAIAGLYHPRNGRICADGELWFDTQARVDLAPQVRRVGLVFQDYALFPHLSALDNVRLAMLHMAEPARSRLASALLARVSLGGLDARRPDQLSGGQRQRVAIARALARDPRVLLLDEPFSAVDRNTRDALKEELAALHRSLEVPIVFVTHDLEEAQALADRICVLDGGKTLQVGLPDDVRLRPTSARVARLMGQKNLIAATVDDAGHIRCGSTRLAVSSLNGWRAGEQAIALVPPDAIALIGGEGPTENVVSGTVSNVQQLGDLAALTLELPQGTLRFRIAAREAVARSVKVGARIRVHLDPGTIHMMRED
jgi:molybdate transport system ATP-binding protein